MFIKGIAVKKILSSYISQNEILRYLHYKGQVIPEEMQHLIEEVLDETLNTIHPKYSLKRLPVHIVSPTVHILADDKSILYQLSSYDLCKAMEGSDFFVFGAVTLGYEIVRKINSLMLTSPTRAIIMDACASVAVDAFCDYLQDELKNNPVASDLSKGIYNSQRYSPGYGDLNLEVQRVIADLINTEKSLGIHLTQHFQLQPEKSVFFIIGLSQKPFKSKLKTCGNDCSACLLKNCPYKEA